MCVVLGCWPIPAASAQPAQSRQNQTLFQNAMVFDGNPNEDINLIADPDRNFVLIMKGGKVYKNELE